MKPLQIIRRISEIVGQACLHGEMVWIALLAQGLIWLQTRLFPNANQQETELYRTLPENANGVKVVCQPNTNRVFPRIFSGWLITLSLVLAGLGSVVLVALVKR